jgi:hypothetical protein
MRPAPSPRVHLFVCANRREGSPLGPGCGDRGEAVYAALKEEVARRGRIADVWVTKTHCLGICPKDGCTVARWPAARPSTILTEVEAKHEDVFMLVDGAEPTAIEAELEALEELQKKKVLDLARRLRPDLTAEDIQNPHDFPELADPDWHYADGVLAGVQSARAALRALRGS